MAGKTGCNLSPGRGGHLIVRLGDRKTVLPMHGRNHEMPTGTASRIKNDFGLK